MITKIELQKALDAALISGEALTFRVSGYKATFSFHQNARSNGSVGRGIYMVEDGFTGEYRVGNAELQLKGVYWYTFHPMGNQIKGTIYYSKITLLPLPVKINQPLQTV